MRFQPVLGEYIAAAVGSTTSIMDVETAQSCGNALKVRFAIFKWTIFPEGITFSILIKWHTSQKVVYSAHCL